LQKKRSLEEVDADDDDNDEENTRHVRKRSREAVPGADVEVASAVHPPANGTRTPDAEDEDMAMQSGLTSPKNKRTRDQVFIEARDAPAEDAPTPGEERKTKRARDSGSPQPSVDADRAAKIPPTSGGFANASAASPFGALAAKSPDAKPQMLSQTSDEKFKSSGFGAFAAAAASPFGAAAPKAASPFGGAASTGLASPWAAKPATSATQPSAFAAAASGPPSGFGSTSTSSGFGGLGKSSLGGGGFGSTTTPSSVFGAVVPGGSKLSAFAAGTGPTIQGLSSKPAKAFGASNDSDEDEEGDTDEEGADDSGAKSPNHEGDVRKDRRFYEQHIETGEEGETTMFQQRAKLYQFVPEEKKWVERGSGVLKLNVSEPEDSERDSDHDDEDDDDEDDDDEGGGRGGEEGKDKVKLMDAPSFTEDDDGSEDETGNKKTKKKKPKEKPIHARLLLRADGSQRVVLNSPVRKGFKFGDDTEPKGQNILFLGRLTGIKEGGDDAGLHTLQVKVCCFIAVAFFFLSPPFSVV
jgi:Ran-binding protein 3